MVIYYGVEVGRRRTDSVGSGSMQRKGVVLCPVTHCAKFPMRDQGSVASRAWCLVPVVNSNYGD